MLPPMADLDLTCPPRRRQVQGSDRSGWHLRSTDGRPEAAAPVGAPTREAGHAAERRLPLPVPPAARQRRPGAGRL